MRLGRQMHREVIVTGGDGRSSDELEGLIRTYFDACNAADIDRIAACFTPDAVHYFPPGMYGGPLRGAFAIVEKWKSAVENVGSYWTVDWLLTDPPNNAAVIEWTHFKTKQGVALRGSEVYLFDSASGLIKEIRAYYAAPQDATLKSLQLEGFDYEGRGYASAPPYGVR